MKKATAMALLVTACASAPSRQAPAARSPLLDPPASMAVCTTWEDERGALTLPDPCRMEITPGEWLVVRNVVETPRKRRSWLWSLVLGFLLF